ncbi:hypothetical protein BDQ12DRAFT_635406 [Crucibulum laeve]|uniref:ABM domain-containing protein n=1 Tax=Crucibulum laeve TaxID=68775 RepID=A0A5C3LR04_9AGAR|nr:hypothetical protein BDQ12DRAFT_635406 [Crucibulum laeve]
MTSTEAKFGLFVPLVSQLDRAEDVAKLLDAGYDLALAEPETIQWFALKYANATPTTYAIFDTFATESGRSAHLSGKIAEALMAKAPKLLSPAPEIGQVEVLASKVKSSSDGKTAGLSVGLRVLIEAKPEKTQALKDFLISALPLVEEESETLVWYAIHFTGTNKFGIVDFFPNEGGRSAHIKGKVAAALFASADELLMGAPDIAKVDVQAAKVIA